MEIENSIILTECLLKLKDFYNNGKREFIDLIYIDPPFNSQRDFNLVHKSNSDMSEKAFKDTWTSDNYMTELMEIAEISPKLYEYISFLSNIEMPVSYIAYLTSLGKRCWYMRELLKPTGSFYFHCDDTMGAHVKLMLDILYGVENFRSQICWKRNFSPGSGRKSQAKKYSRNADYIFLYSKTKNFYFNCPSIPMDEEKIRKGYKLDDNDGRGLYYWANFNYNPPVETLKKGIKDNRMMWDKEKTKYPLYKKYKNESDLSIKIGNIWEDIYPVLKHKERIGYPTQKPIKLLKRIISASSREGELVADFYMGGGTTIIAAEELNRKWIGTDINHRSLQVTFNRLESINRIPGRDFIISGIPMTIQDLKRLTKEGEKYIFMLTGYKIEDLVFKYYVKNIHIQGNISKTGDGQIDGRYFVKYKDKMYRGIAQVTISKNLNHFLSFCNRLKDTLIDYNYGVYITFDENVTPSMKKEAASFGKLFGVPVLQIVTFEDLLERGKEIKVPTEILKF